MNQPLSIEQRHGHGEGQPRTPGPVPRPRRRRLPHRGLRSRHRRRTPRSARASGTAAGPVRLRRRRVAPDPAGDPRGHGRHRADPRRRRHGTLHRRRARGGQRVRDRGAAHRRADHRSTPPGPATTATGRGAIPRPTSTSCTRNPRRPSWATPTSTLRGRTTRTGPACSRGARALFLRNVSILAGALDDDGETLPVRAVIAYTPNGLPAGREAGGTGHTLRTAASLGIPCVNLSPRTPPECNAAALAAVPAIVRDAVLGRVPGLPR